MGFTFKLEGKIRDILNRDQINDLTVVPKGTITGKRRPKIRDEMQYIKMNIKDVTAVPEIILTGRQKSKIRDEMQCLKMSIESQTRIRRLMNVSLADLNKSITKSIDQYEELDFIIEGNDIFKKYRTEKGPTAKDRDLGSKLQSE